MKQIINYQDTQIGLSAKLNFKPKKPISSFQSPGNFYLSKIVMLFIDFALWFQASVEIMKNRITVQKDKNTELLNEYVRAFQSVSFVESTSAIKAYINKTEEKSKNYDHTLQMLLESIDSANNLQFCPFLVFKTSSLGRYNLYKKIAKGVTLSKREQKEWSEVKERFKTVCRKAQTTCGTKIIIDAEESWVQDCIDELAIELMQEFNKERVIVFLEVQMYRWDRLDFLLSLNKKAKRENFKVGVKLEKGNYRKKETARAKVKGYQSPLCIDDESTETNFTSALRYCLHYLGTFELFSDLENQSDAKLLAEYMNRYQLSNDDRRIWFGQLLGGTSEGISLYGR